jgi:hypothetical protein
MYRNYNAQSFKKTFASPIGQLIFHFLISLDGVKLLKLASDNKRPAAEGVADLLLLKFGIGVINKRVKQATGHMIRYVMEENGYKFVKNHVPCNKNQIVYVSASLYEK